MSFTEIYPTRLLTITAGAAARINEALELNRTDLEGSWLNFADFRDYLQRLMVEFPNHAKTLAMLDEAIVAGVIEREDEE